MEGRNTMVMPLKIPGMERGRVSTLLGTAGALGMYYCKRRTKTFIGGVSQIPVIKPFMVAL